MGIEIGGYTTSQIGMPAIIKKVRPGETYTITFSFFCQLNPGTYFINAGVLGNIDGEEAYMHRILDACVFRIKAESENLSTGFVDFDFKATIDQE